MKLTFISNYMSHHQLPFCLEMQQKLGEDFRFVATKPIEQEKLDLGYVDENHKYDFILCTFDSKENEDLAKSLIMESDVVIQGGSDTTLIRDRLETTDKLTFRYIERLFKKGISKMLDPRVQWQLYRSHTKYRNKNFYLLCAGGYVAMDCKIINAYTGKMFKWGYFPKIENYNIESLVKNKPTKPIQLLWVGRFIDWKHSEYALSIARKLKKDNYPFVLKMIGTGILLDSMKEKANKYGLTDSVIFTGPMPPEKVRENIEHASIFLFTSDYNEGWGAVLNESMNSGCAVVVSHAIGAAPYLIKDGENGLIFKSGNIKEMYSCVKWLIDNPKERATLGVNAYNSIKTGWTPEIAAERLYQLISNLYNGNFKQDLYVSGPCSKEIPVPQSKMYFLQKGKINEENCVCRIHRQRKPRN